MSIEVGQKVTGKVTGITHFGAFVQLPDNKTGLIHISEVSATYVKDIATVLTVGQDIEVKVLNIAEDGKISLSAKQAAPQPETKRPQRAPKEKREFRPKEDNKETVERKPMRSNRPSPRFEKRVESEVKVDAFDQLMSNFLKDSEDRLTSLRRNTEGKRGGRGGRRS